MKQEYEGKSREMKNIMLLNKEEQEQRDENYIIKHHSNLNKDIL